MKYVILKVLREKPMHGYEVMKALEEQTSGCYKPSPGTVYPTLQWLEDEGLVEGEDREGKKVYRITESGLAFLDEHKSTVEDIFDRVDEMIDHIVGDPMPEVNRRIGRLVSQVYRTSWRVRRDEERRGQIAAILDRAVKDLEELLAESPGVGDEG
jgi:DNA-binding PadR family transcriptional regulator